jgi:hypothetical protein
MSVQGATLFSDPNGTEWMVVAAEGRVFVTGENRVAREISLNGATLTGDCSFTQTYDKLLLWRGTASAPLQMETFDGGFVAVTQTRSGAGEGTGTQVIPNSDGARFFQNRVFVPFIYVGTKKDFVAVGDIGNYTRYKFPQNAFRFNDGADDDIVDVAPFGRTSMAVFKQKSVRIVDNLVPDSSGDYSAAVSDIVTSTHGLVARGAWVAVGRDLFYVSTRGVTSLQLTEENRVKGVDLPLSAPLEATWNRINWRFRDQIRIGYWDNKLYVALPLDDARVMDTSANLATGTYTLFGGFGRITFTGQPSGWYYYERGANDTSAVGASGEAFAGFVQASALGVIYLFGTLSAACTATLYYVPFYNCNTAVAVYDFLTQAWAGVDQTDHVTHVKEFLTATIQGKQRLVAVTEDGLLRLWEEGFEDERLTTIASPYVDITVQSQPTGADTLQLNNASGSLIDVDSGATTNFGDTWGTGFSGGSLATARANLYAGYAGNWTKPGGTVTQQDWGIRWTSTTSTLPPFNLNGVEIHNSGNFDWAYVDLITGTQITTQSVSTSVTTRAYAMQDMDGKRFQQVGLRLVTWDPTFSITGLTDGVNETSTVATGQTRDNTVYSISQAAWVSTNANDDHGDPWREDYSVAMGSGFNLGSGVAMELEQQSLVRLKMQQRGNSCQLTLANTSGRCTLKGVEMEAIPGDRTMGTKYSG